MKCSLEMSPLMARISMGWEVAREREDSVADRDEGLISVMTSLVQPARTKARATAFPIPAVSACYRGAYLFHLRL
jgi:hypothetical protein